MERQVVMASAQKGPGDLIVQPKPQRRRAGVLCGAGRDALKQIQVEEFIWDGEIVTWNQTRRRHEPWGTTRTCSRPNANAYF